MTAVRQGIERVLGEYLAASKEAFTHHQLANFIRKDLRDAVADATGEKDRLRLKASCGQSQWARGPWVGIYNPVVTTSAQHGYYTCYLFREDMQGVYLSLNQAMTEAKENYKSDAKTALQARAGNFRAMLGSQLNRFPLLDIDLAPDSPHNDTAFYQAGNICAKYYPVTKLPSEEQFVTDLRDMLKLYEALIVGQTDGEYSSDVEDDFPHGIDHEDATRFRLHKRIERNDGLIKKVKKAHGCTCAVCGLNFEGRYGPIGKGYIEAHHLIPLASIKGTKVAMDPIKDFAVLCANCHRMIHRSGCVDDVEKFKAEHFHG